MMLYECGREPWERFIGILGDNSLFYRPLVRMFHAQKTRKTYVFLAFALKSFYLICTYSYYISVYIDAQTHLKRMAMILKDTLICGHNI